MSTVDNTQPSPARCVPWMGACPKGAAGATEIVFGVMEPALWLNWLRVGRWVNLAYYIHCF